MKPFIIEETTGVLLKDANLSILQGRLDSFYRRGMEDICKVYLKNGTEVYCRIHFEPYLIKYQVWLRGRDLIFFPSFDSVKVFLEQLDAMPKIEDLLNDGITG